MSNFPMPKEIPFHPQHVAGTLKSVLFASQNLIKTDPRHFPDLQDDRFPILLTPPPSNSYWASLPRAPPTPPPDTPRTKGLTHATAPTYASKAAAKARPSLVLELGATTPKQQINEELTADLNYNATPVIETVIMEVHTDTRQFQKDFTQ
ncbi:hypothetical protein BJV74DRAFT_795178 [Russula compacta]|nr:hypothetical protein BJV74DRAFT_795178 [Russula compacta]